MISQEVTLLNYNIATLTNIPQRRSRWFKFVIKCLQKVPEGCVCLAMRIFQKIQFDLFNKVMSLGKSQLFQIGFLCGYGKFQVHGKLC